MEISIAFLIGVLGGGLAASGLHIWFLHRLRDRELERMYEEWNKTHTALEEDVPY